MLQHDKALHIIAGVGASALPYLTAPWFGPLPWWWAAVAAATAGLAKEAYDHFHPAHTVDAYDFLATVLGCLPVALTLGVARGY